MSFKRAKWIIAFIAAALLVSGAEGCPPTSGTITDRKFTPKHQSTKNPNDKLTKKQIPDTWELHLVSGDRKGWITVNKTTYEKCQIKERYPDCIKN